VPGYRRALIDQLADIMAAERESTIRKIAIQQKVTDYCEALGEFLARRSGPGEATE